MPERVAEAMQLQVEAERNKRAKVLESEGEWVLVIHFLFKLWSMFVREDNSWCVVLLMFFIKLIQFPGVKILK